MAIKDQQVTDSVSKQTEASISPASVNAQRPASQKQTYGTTGAIISLLALLVVFLSMHGDALIPVNSPSMHMNFRSHSSLGSFIQPPLTAAQINQLAHLSTHMSYKRLAQMYLSHMTLDEELGQLIMAEYYDTSYSDDLETMITRLHAGGVVMYALQMHTFDQTHNDILKMQKHAQIPLLISADEEGGFVERIQNIYGHRPGALEIYQTGNPENAAKAGHKIAHDLLALGINTDLAPDVDVQLVDGPDQYLRTWGYTPQSVITYAGKYMQALQSDGAIACIKHFPGLGAANIDAHFGLPIVNRTRDQIYSVELAPFKAFIQSKDSLENPGMIMPTDILMPAIDPVWPAELSHTFMTDILRKEFGYDGVVITDALYMKGISNKWNLGQAAVLALNAGDDMLLGANGSYQMEQMLDAIKAALQDGTLSKARVDEAATRILTLKLERHLMPVLLPQDYGLAFQV